MSGLEHPSYGLLRPVTETASVLLCENPGLMTLDGTNTWVLRGPGSDEMVVVDPGPDDKDEHIERLAELGPIPLVLISHRHSDHTGGIDRLVDLTGAVVRSVGSGFQRGLGGPLTDGEVIDAAGLRITVLATPGHTADSVSFLVDDDDGGGAVLTADTILGRGTTVIDAEDGDLGDYLESLRRLRGLGRRRVLPGHGPELDDLAEISDTYLTHREERLDQVRGALTAIGEDASARQVVEHVYTDVDEKLWDAAEWSVQAQLNYLRR
ncbi:MBL fold metallo-hydrolase [Mycolicibacterium vaccae]|uniref:MBL fold metallo-hydrolase n=1 Tax=Mycolicibacterium vaccae TaxID=1810 RepID=UPI003CFDEF65